MKSLLLSISTAAITSIPINREIIELKPLKNIISARVTNSIAIPTIDRQDRTNKQNKYLFGGDSTVSPSNLTCISRFNCLNSRSNTNLYNSWSQQINYPISSQWNIGHLLVSKLAVIERSLTPANTSIAPETKSFPQIDRSSLIVPRPDGNSSEFIHPAPQTERIASPFGWRNRPYSGQRQFHEGIDYGAPLGSPVVAATDGIVIKVVSGCRDFGDRFCGSQFGNSIQVDSGNGQIITYAHLLQNSIKVKPGMTIRQHQEIAQVGSSGWSTGAHLDFRIEVNGKYRNPTEYIKG